MPVSQKPASLVGFFTSLSKHQIGLSCIIAIALFMRLYRLSQAPPGISGDEMFNAVDIASIHWRNLPIYFEGNNGREALFFYLMAFSTRLLGTTVFALRLPAALLGTGSVLLAYGLGRTALNRHIGLLAAALTAVSLWPIMESRWALRAVSLTFFTALTLFLMIRGWQNGRRRDWLLGGIALGLTMYTYIPSRAFPAVILIWLLWLGWFNSARLRQQWPSIALSLLLALLIFLPYGNYMRQNPEKVNQRISGLTVALDEALTDGQWHKLSSSISATLKTFTIQGDIDWRYHLADQPIFDAITGLFFYSGLAIALWFTFASRQPAAENAPATQPTYALLLVWMSAMLGPNLIIDDQPSMLRAAGAIVPIYLLTAVGLHTIATNLSHKWPRLTPLMPLMAIIGLSLILVRTWHDYFGVWSNHPEVRRIYQAEFTEIANYLEENPPPPETRLFIGRSYAHDGAPQTWKYYSQQAVNWFVPDQSFPVVADDAWFFVLDRELTVPELFQQLPLQTADLLTHPDGQPIATRYEWLGPRQWITEQTADLHFHHAPTLTGYTMPHPLYGGNTITILTTWQIPPEMPRLANQIIFIQAELEDENGNIWAKAEGILGYPQAHWQPHDSFIQLLNLTIPEGMLPGNSYLRFTLHDGKGNVYSPAPNNISRVGPHFIHSQPLTNFQLPADMLLFDDTLALQSTSFSTLLSPGLPINIALNWVALRQPTADYQIELQLWLPNADEPYFVQQSAIWPGIYPPSAWEANAQVSSFHQLLTPLDIPTTADPQLRLQLLTPDGQAVPISQGDNKLADMSLSLRQHLFTVPPISQPLVAQFGDAIQLLGYDIAPGDNALHLTLYWQALATPAKHYTVFNHLLDAGGQMVGQFDGPPSGEAWLTVTWLPGEIVIDKRTIPLQPNLAAADYSLLVGLYTAGDGQRLPVWLNGVAQEGDQLRLTAVSLPSAP